jgi:ferredoxin, 2Fe-2S
MTQTEITFLPEDKKVQVRPGITLLDAGRKARVQIRTRCGGKAACLMCKVKVENQTGLAPMNDNERNKLGGQAALGYRLACQALVRGEVTVELPEDPLKAAIRAQLAKQQEQDDWI